MGKKQWTVVISAEIARWYELLSPADRRVVDRMIMMLAEYGNDLRMPHSRSLGRGLFELRFAIARAAIEQRITYTFDLGRMVVTLTTFRKTKDNEAREVSRARKAKEERL
ncbi:MAG: type II toxin-antitoxin system RelE/ParE family toxin [Propionibacteriaceae bacterium]|nr:type II toxin-antitoxin system RelE/ParE family toxin [Propionibacteriaceae bacterium]